jgi:polysaccharide biosynthesis protein PslG
MVVDEPTWPDQYVNLAQQFDTMVASGVESVRVAIDWSQFQPYAGWAQVPAAARSQFVNAGGVPTDFSTLDELVGAAASHRITVLPVIENAPSWDGQSYPGGIVSIPRTPGPYAAFAGALVRRYGHGGSFWRANPGLPKVPIGMWQVWNEPNIQPAFWPPHPYYARYVALLRAAHDAIKAADPKAKIVLAGLPNYSWIEIGRINRIAGASRLYDIVAVHPYTKTPQGVITIIGFVRHVLDVTGAAGKPILADEISWPSSEGQTTHDTGYDFATTEAGQAQNVPQAVQLLAANRLRLGIAGFYYYDWAGQDRPNYLAFDFAGLFHFSGGQFQPKPVYNPFRTTALSIEGCRSKAGTATNCQR